MPGMMTTNPKTRHRGSADLMQQHRAWRQPMGLRLLPACVAVRLGTALLTAMAGRMHEGVTQGKALRLRQAGLMQTAVVFKAGFGAG